MVEVCGCGVGVVCISSSPGADVVSEEGVVGEVFLHIVERALIHLQLDSLSQEQFQPLWR